MCKAISGIAVYDGESVKVYTLPDSDSHSDIREKHHIRDDSLTGIASRQTPVELVPIKDLFDVKGMDFRFDDSCPYWWTDDDMTDEAIRQLHAAWMSRWDGKCLHFEGDLYLGSLTSLPEGVTLTAGGNLDLRSLTSLPKGVKVKANRYV